MAEEQKFKIWHVVQSVIASLLVFAVVNLSNTLGELNDNVIKHEILIEQLNEFRSAGDRFTARDGAVMQEKIMLMNENQVRMWEAIRKHISEAQHNGADYRLKRLEELIGSDHHERNR